VPVREEAEWIRILGLVQSLAGTPIRTFGGAPEDCMDRSAIAAPVADLHDDKAMDLTRACPLVARPGI
jgi:hypothetical protein